MHVAFSALRQQQIQQSTQNTDRHPEDTEVLLRFRAYEAACEKHKDEIRAIQKYIPGWMPAFTR